MHDDLASAVDASFPTILAELETMVRIPSVSASAFDPAEVRRSADHVAEALRRHGFADVRLLEVDGAHPAVFGEIAGPEGSPTVLLYAHHDVQPPGPAELWTTPPFEPVERDGRLFGRGSSDDKAGIAVHLGAIGAHRGRPPVGVKVFVEGEEETGSVHLGQFVDRYGDLLAADVLVVADSENWRVGSPALTTSLRGLVDCVVEVRTLEKGVHSGAFGGAVPDALTALCKLLATLHDDEGTVAIAGLGGYPVAPLDLTEPELRTQAGTLPGTALIGTGTLTERMWTRPACSVLAIDAPPVAEAINQLVPSASAKVSLRIPPGVEATTAMDALVGHLRDHAPWGADVEITPGSGGEPIALDSEGPAFDAWRTAMTAAWGHPPVDIGVGGSIPFVAELRRRFPDAAILLTGAADPTSAAHGPDESLDLDELRRAIVAEAIALRLLAG